MKDEQHETNNHVMLGSSVWTGIQPGASGEIERASGSDSLLGEWIGGGSDLRHGFAVAAQFYRTDDADFRLSPSHIKA